MADRTASRTPGYLWTTKAHLLRQPGYLREARGFASPPRDGFAIYRSAVAGEALTDGTNVRRTLSPAREAYPAATGSTSVGIRPRAEWVASRSTIET
jgi:hypothetical protein